MPPRSTRWAGAASLELHHRDEAVAAGERAGVLAEIGEQGDGFLDGFGAVVGECAWDHGFLPGRVPGSGLCPPRPAAHRVDVRV